MNTQNWFILIYATESAEMQVSVASELRGFGGLSVQTEQKNGEHFVIVESSARITAITLHELVMTIDSHAELVSSHPSAQRRSAPHALQSVG